MASEFFDISRVVNTSVLQEIENAFFEGTGLSTGIHDLSGELLTHSPKDRFNRFCYNMYFSRQGHKRCRRSNIAGAQKAFSRGETYIYHCHACLVDVAAPIIVNGRHVGDVTCGQILVDELTPTYRERVRARLSSLPTEFQEEQMRALEEVRVFPLKRVRGLAKLLSAVANNIVSLIISNVSEKELNLKHVKALDEIRARALLEQEIKNAQLGLKEAELRALQAQINPHFLYNTLDSIQWLATLHGAEDIRAMVHALAQMLRHSLDRRNSVVSIRKELEQIRSYLLIQQMRFGAKFSYQLNVEDEVLDFSLPRLVLQPLVENAILHGIEPKAEAGTLRIDGWIENQDKAVLEVIDDGVGISEDRRREIQKGLEAGGRSLAESEEGPGHLGLANVHRRLVHLFGEDYGIKVESERTGGTCVRIRVPRVKSER